MPLRGPKSSYERDAGFTVVRSAPQSFTSNAKTLGFLIFAMLVSNLLTVTIFRSGWDWLDGPEAGLAEEAKATEDDDPSLYLLEKASMYVDDETKFESKVREVCDDLSIPPEWLMAVMYSESRFDAAVLNRRGSGAVGLIQWMPLTAKEMNVSTSKLREMDHIEQLDYVHKYLSKVSERYGDFKSLTELYLAILYPKALDEDYCYTLYAKPSKQYLQNAGLDENKDGRVTVSDIDKRMQRIFPTAYLAMRKNED